jgi:hypothetical protein
MGDDPLRFQEAHDSKGAGYFSTGAECLCRCLPGGLVAIADQRPNALDQLRYYVILSQVIVNDCR